MAAYRSIYPATAVLAGLCTLFACRERTHAEVQAPATPATQPATQPVLSTLDGDWPAFHGGGTLAGATAAIVDAPVAGANVPLAVRWQYKCGPEGEVAEIEGSAAIVGDTVYIADGK